MTAKPCQLLTLLVLHRSVSLFFSPRALEYSTRKKLYMSIPPNAHVAPGQPSVSRGDLPDSETLRTTRDYDES